MLLVSVAVVPVFELIVDKELTSNPVSTLSEDNPLSIFDIDIPELKIAKSNEITYFNSYVLHDIGIEAFTNNIIEFFEKSDIKDLYISIDIDALDPSIAPGTGYAIPGGFTYREVWKILREVAKNVNIIGFDIVEVSPTLDLPNNITLKVAAKIIIELMYFILSSK